MRNLANTLKTMEKTVIKKIWHGIALSSLLMLSYAGSAFAHPELFSDASFEQAKEQAKQEHKILLIDFMATWCPPCRMMESTTWEDNAVKAWIKDNAVAIQIDVDKDRKTSSKLDIDAMPTMVLFTPESGDTEFGRQVGYLEPSELLQWLKEARSGKTGEEVEKSKVNASTMWEHIGKAHELTASKQNDAALQEFVWLWNNLPKDDSTFSELRATMVPVEMRLLCASYPDAKVKIGELRDAAEKAGNRGDWLILNGALDDNARTLTWFDKVKNDPAQREEISKNGALLEPALFGSSRWTDAASYLYPDPIGKINEYYKRAEELKKPRPDTEVAKDFDPFPNMVLLVYGAYVGAGRDADAKKIFDECVRLDDTPTMRLGLTNMAKGIQTARTATNKQTKQAPSTH